MTFFLLWVLCGIVSAVVASSRGGNGCLYAFIGFLLGPFGIILAFVASPSQSVTPAASSPVALADAIKPESAVFDALITEKRCPDCAELIKIEARICRFCRHSFSELDVLIAVSDAEEANEKAAATFVNNQREIDHMVSCYVCGIKMPMSQALEFNGTKMCSVHYAKAIL